MTSEEYKKISLIDYLGNLGILPDHTRKSGNEIWYLSPFRKEKTPSFKITVDKNTWYDFGADLGGSIIDFVRHFYKLSVGEAFKHLNDHETKPMPLLLKNIPSYEKTNRIEIRSVKVLKNPALIAYVNSRFIDIQIARKYINEIYYRRGERNFFTVGMENDSKGYEVRTKFFKGSILTKDITSIVRGFNTVSIFEGFIDFLSLLTILKKDTLKSDVIILHSVAIVKRAKPIIDSNKYQKIYAFLDNDPAGNKALLELGKIENVEVKDMRYLYTGYNDINDRLKSNQSD